MGFRLSVNNVTIGGLSVIFLTVEGLMVVPVVEINYRLMMLQTLNHEVTDHILYLYWIYSILPNLRR